MKMFQVLMIVCFISRSFTWLCFFFGLVFSCGFPSCFSLWQVHNCFLSFGWVHLHQKLCLFLSTGSHVTWVTGILPPPFAGALCPVVLLVVLLGWDQSLWHSLCWCGGQLRSHSSHGLCVGFGALRGDVVPLDSTWEPGSSAWL